MYGNENYDRYFFGGVIGCLEPYFEQEGEDEIVVVKVKL
jgi:hypothetical protein